MSISTYTVTEHNSVAIAERIAEDVRQGASVTVNGNVPVMAWGNAAATSWNNGSVSVRVAAKAKGKFRDVFFKVGSTVTVSVA